MIYKGHEIEGNLEFVFGNDKKVDAFTVFAKIVEQDTYFVTVARYQNFGKLRISDDTLFQSEFNMHYNPIEADPPRKEEKSKITRELTF